MKSNLLKITTISLMSVGLVLPLGSKLLSSIGSSLNTMMPFNNVGNKINSPTGVGINQTFVDRSGNVWLGTNKGLFFKSLNFDTYNKIDGVIGNSNVTAIYQDQNGNMWFGTQVHGLFNSLITSPQTVNQSFNSDTKAGAISDALIQNITWISAERNSADNSGTSYYIAFSGTYNTAQSQNYIFWKQIPKTGNINGVTTIQTFPTIPVGAQIISFYETFNSTTQTIFRWFGTNGNGLFFNQNTENNASNTVVQVPGIPSTAVISSLTIGENGLSLLAGGISDNTPQGTSSLWYNQNAQAQGTFTQKNLQYTGNLNILGTKVFLAESTQTNSLFIGLNFSDPAHSPLLVDNNATGNSYNFLEVMSLYPSKNPNTYLTTSITSIGLSKNSGLPLFGSADNPAPGDGSVLWVPCVNNMVIHGQNSGELVTAVQGYPLALLLATGIIGFFIIATIIYIAVLKTSQHKRPKIQ